MSIATHPLGGGVHPHASPGSDNQSRFDSADGDNKNLTYMQHEESLIQQQCVAWFRIQYPHLATLLYHIANEGSTSKAYVGGIRKAEGLVPGVPDLMLNIPARYGNKLYHFFGIEMKTAKGKQSPSQKAFQAYFEAAGNHYFIVRSLEEFTARVTEYVNHMPKDLAKALREVHTVQREAALQAERNRLQRIIKKSQHES